MSTLHYFDQVARLEKDIANLQRKIADESRREIDKQRQIDSINRSMSRNTSPPTLQMKQRQIQGYQSDIYRIQSTKADLQKQIASKTSDLTNKRIELNKMEKRERDKERTEQDNLQKRLQSEIQNQKELLTTLLHQTYKPNLSEETKKEYDFFISHATEDKESIVRPLAEMLINNGLKVWYDEFQLIVGDSLRKKIDEGLFSSKFGIVVLSRDFFKKNWPEYELNGLVAKEMNGSKVILPIWHNVTRDEVLSFSPSLADKVALNTAIHSISEIVIELKKLI